MSKTRIQKDNQSTTRLAELRNTLVLFGVLLALFFCAFFVVNNLNSTGYRAKAEKARHDLQELLKKSEIFKNESGYWPKDTRELCDYFSPEGRTPGLGPHINDPWSNIYEFKIVEDNLQIVSYGRDGQPGGAGEDRDLFVSSIQN